MGKAINEKFISIFPSNDRWYLQNSIFDTKKKDEWNRFFVKLKKNLNQKNIEINTYDIQTEKAPYKYVYIDLPYPWNFSAWKLVFLNRKKNILILTEPPMVHPFNYIKAFHIFFYKIYTWNSDLADNEKTFNYRLPKSDTGINTSPKRFKNKKLLVLINANKLSFYPFKHLMPFGRELYSERIEAIEFFENKIPDKFFLYGKGWNKPRKHNLKENTLGFKKYSTYKGEVMDKIKVLKNFKYCLCFENMTDVNGYITEKIFDCFKARCIPIYLGAQDIEKIIPKECFIDFRNFKGYEELLNYLSSIDEKEYNNYIKNIRNLLKDKKFSKLWFEDGFTKFFIEDVLEIKH